MEYKSLEDLDKILPKTPPPEVIYEGFFVSSLDIPKWLQELNKGLIRKALYKLILVFWF